MKFFLVLVLIFSYANAEVPLPSVSPINVFEYDKDIRGIGYYQFNVENYEYDYGYSTPIPMGDVEYEASGIMYVWPKFDTYEVLGFEVKHFESAISVGNIGVTLNTKANPNNDLAKSGFFVGYHPAFTSPLHKSKNLNISIGASLPLVLHVVTGEWHVVEGFIDDGIYEEETYGIAFKPTLTIQGSYYIGNDFALLCWFNPFYKYWN